MTDEDKNEYFEYLDDLRESGIVNMFGARPFLMKEFPQLNKNEAGEIMSEWMKTFADRHKEQGNETYPPR
jgi:hypothetical protein